jgi:hypothetical protein
VPILKKNGVLHPCRVAEPLNGTVGSLAAERRFDPVRVEAFIGFITSPSVVSDLPFGSREQKLSDGTVVQLPNMMRMMDPAKIILMYELYLKENQLGVALKMSHTTYRKILKHCSAEKRHSAHGIHYITKDGLEGFETMERIIKDHMDDIPETRNTMPSLYVRETLKKNCILHPCRVAEPLNGTVGSLAAERLNIL